MWDKSESPFINKEVNMELKIDKTVTTKKYYIDYTAIHVGAGHHEPVEILTETEVNEDTTEFEGNDLLSFKDAAEELLDERYEQLDRLNEERRIMLAEIRTLEEAETFEEYQSLNEKYGGTSE